MRFVVVLHRIHGWMELDGWITKLDVSIPSLADMISGVCFNIFAPEISAQIQADRYSEIFGNEYIVKPLTREVCKAIRSSLSWRTNRPQCVFPQDGYRQRL